MRRALLETWPGRLLVAAAVVKAVVAALGVLAGVPPIVGLAGAAASWVAIGAALYFLARAVSLLLRRFLWRVRRKLVLSYVFIGFIPAFLIVVFFLLAGLLLFSTVGSYLLEARLRALTEEAASLASATAADIVRTGDGDLVTVIAGRAEQAAHDRPGLSLALVPAGARCGNQSESASSSRAAQPDAPAGARATVLTAGPWSHATPPPTIPVWTMCRGFHGLLAYGEPGEAAAEPSSGAPSGDERGQPPLGLVARAVAFPAVAVPHYAVVVDVPVNGPAVDRLWRDTGVELSEVHAIGSRAPVVAGRPAGPSGAAPRGSTRTLMFPDIVDWGSGEVRSGVVYASIRLGVGEMYGRMSAAQGAGANRTVGQGLLLVLMVVGALFLIMEAVALTVGFALARSITGSVHELFAGTERVRRGDFSQKIAVRARDQLGALATSFNSMADAIETLLGEQAEKRRLEEELRIAHDIQMSLLPQGPLDTPGLSVTAMSVPAREVGGDYYDLFALGEGRVGVLVADVSGKGMSAALYMAELKGLMLSLSRIHQSPRELLIAADRAIGGHLGARSFITMAYAVIDTGRRTATFARAGHTPLIHLPAAGRDPAMRILAPDGLALGLDSGGGTIFGRLLQEDTIALGTDDLLILFTDGISEAMNERNDGYGEARLGRLLEECSLLPGEVILERVRADVEAFTAGVPRHDDMTLILVRIGAPAAGGAPDYRGAHAIDAAGRSTQAYVATEA